MGSGKGSWLVRVGPSEACRSVEEAEGKAGTQGTDCIVPLKETVSYCIEGAWHWKCGKVLNLDQQILQSGQESPVKKKKKRAGGKVSEGKRVGESFELHEGLHWILAKIITLV